MPEAVLAKLATRSSLTPDSGKLILAMVGLPARGKSFICHKLRSFLSWSGFKTEVFNAGQKRRNATEPEESKGGMKRARSSADFFDPTNTSAASAREQIAMETFDELLDWLGSGGEVAIFDATNSNRARRSEVVQRAAHAAERLGESVNVVFIESVCDEPAVLEANMLTKVRSSPDFNHLSEADAMADLKKRISNYEAAYESVADEEGAFVKLYNLSSKVTANQVFGRMSKSVLPYMMSLHVVDRPVYLASLPGGSNVAEADSEDADGWPAFARKIAGWLQRSSPHSSLRLLSSTQPGTEPPGRWPHGAVGWQWAAEEAVGGRWKAVGGSRRQ